MLNNENILNISISQALILFISKWTIPEYSTIDGKLSRIGEIGETETFIVP